MHEFLPPRVDRERLRILAEQYLALCAIQAKAAAPVIEQDKELMPDAITPWEYTETLARLKGKTLTVEVVCAGANWLKVINRRKRK